MKIFNSKLFLKFRCLQFFKLIMKIFKHKSPQQHCPQKYDMNSIRNFNFLSSQLKSIKGSEISFNYILPWYS